jgi:hypothetical protein
MWSPLEISRRTAPGSAAVSLTIVVPQRVVSSVTSNSRAAVLRYFRLLDLRAAANLRLPRASEIERPSIGHSPTTCFEHTARPG